MKRLSFGLTSLAVVLAVQGARASDDYPGAMQQLLALASAPPCTICHASMSGGAGTVVKPFGGTMQGFGLAGKNRGSLESALAESRARRPDSDGDGVPDVDELVAGTDPNDGPGQGGLIEAPAYGCALGAAQRPADAGGALLAGMLLGSCFLRRRGSRR